MTKRNIRSYISFLLIIGLLTMVPNTTFAPYVEERQEPQQPFIMPPSVLPGVTYAPVYVPGQDVKAALQDIQKAPSERQRRKAVTSMLKALAASISNAFVGITKTTFKEVGKSLVSPSFWVKLIQAIPMIIVLILLIVFRKQIISGARGAQATYKKMEQLIEQGGESAAQLVQAVTGMPGQVGAQVGKVAKVGVKVIQEGVTAAVTAPGEVLKLIALKLEAAIAQGLKSWDELTYEEQQQMIDYWKSELQTFSPGPSAKSARESLKNLGYEVTKSPVSNWHSVSEQPLPETELKRREREKQREEEQRRRERVLQKELEIVPAPLRPIREQEERRKWQFEDQKPILVSNFRINASSLGISPENIAAVFKEMEKTRFESAEKLEMWLDEKLNELIQRVLPRGVLGKAVVPFHPPQPGLFEESMQEMFATPRGVLEKAVSGAFE